MSNLRNKTRAKESAGDYTTLHGEYRASFLSGAVTLAAAGTTTAGHLMVMRVPTAETKKAVIRYVGYELATVTAMGTQQPLGLDLIRMTGSTAVYTGGAAIDMFTLTQSQKLRANQALTLFTVNNVRMCTTAGLTAGTQNLDSQALHRKFFLSPVLGEVARGDLFDARDDGNGTHRSPIVLAAEEGILVRNVILMGATGVFNLALNVEWDEVTL
jgi:hypothetical protein